MKLKNAIILGIGFSIGKFIFNFTVQFVDRAVDLGNDILDVMQNDGLSFEKSNLVNSSVPVISSSFIVDLTISPFSLISKYIFSSLILYPSGASFSRI